MICNSADATVLVPRREGRGGVLKSWFQLSGLGNAVHLRISHRSQQVEDSCFTSRRAVLSG